MKKIVALTVVVVALAAVPFASAGSSVLTTYGGSSTPVVQVKGATGSGTPQAQTSGPSTLPFTGVDLVLITVAGVTMLGVGFGLRRLGRNRAS
jgi:hypothetical protein